MSDLERVWEECWTRVERGEATVEDCLRWYPEHAQDLRHLFIVANRLNQGRVIRPNAAYKARARAQILAQIQSHPERRARSVPANDDVTGPREEARAVLSGLVPSKSRVIPFALRAGFALAVVLILLLVSGTMLAQAALPGDALYGIKTGSENVFRAVYPDPLTADLVLMDRRANELTRVAGTPAAEHIAQEGYQQVLSDLPQYTDPSSQGKIRKQLTEQKTQLQQAGVNVPAIDRTLKNLSAAPAVTATPTRTATRVRPTSTPPPSAKATVAPNSPLPTVKPTATQTATPTRRPTLTPTPTPTPTVTSTPSPTKSPQATEEPTTRAPSTETPTPARTKSRTPTPCVSRTPSVPVSPGKPCGTPTFSPTPCGIESGTPASSSCATLTRTPTPTITGGSVTPTPTASNTATNTPKKTNGSATPSATPTKTAGPTTFAKPEDAISSSDPSPMPAHIPTAISETPDLFDSLSP